MLTTALEQFNHVEIEQITPTHYQELSEHAKHGIPLNPNYPDYYRRQEAGELVYLTLRSSGVLIGYFIGFFARGLHYDCMTLMLDIIYVTPTARGQKGGEIIMAAVLKEWQRRHGRLWLMGYKEEHRFYMEKLLSLFGFSPYERYQALWSDPPSDKTNGPKG